ncbi:unnamed protein product [Microthlaspi erraticum]|uniref:WRC domain-containing protein n=1 Tax=Microthlaspi erraticum TaxID=1685480 RepID=A0A6D2HTR3_9BRAS|nr:unnamed protein product [Microthlaspi erraticum]
MRIRKNTELSSILLATAGIGGEKLETYVCHLNQSPWDVTIPVAFSGDRVGAAEFSNLPDSSWFVPSPTSSPPPLIHQLDKEDSSDGNESLGNSNGAAQRLNCSMENNHSVETLNLLAAMDDYERSPDVEDPMDRSDDSDKKSESVEPNSPVKTSGDEEQVAVSVPAPPKRGRPRGSGKKAQAHTATNNPYEFYYYSGFGPRWGRKRGGNGDEEMVNLKSCENNMIMSQKSSSSSNGGEESDKTAAFGDGSNSFDGFDYMEEDFEVVDQDSDHATEKKKKKKKNDTVMKKRGRKPVKERSLKSLM